MNDLQETEVMEIRRAKNNLECAWFNNLYRVIFYVIYVMLWGWLIIFATIFEPTVGRRPSNRIKRFQAIYRGIMEK